MCTSHSQCSKLLLQQLVTKKDQMIKLYKENNWMNSIHVHVGSGGMGVAVLTEGIRTTVQTALEINKVQLLVHVLEMSANAHCALSIVGKILGYVPHEHSFRTLSVGSGGRVQSSDLH